MRELGFRQTPIRQALIDEIIWLVETGHINLPVHSFRKHFGSTERNSTDLVSGSGQPASAGFCYLRNLLLCLVLICTSCGSIPREGHQEGVYDPYETFNRKSYRFTDAIDRRLLEPIADVYLKYVPEAIQRPVSNFTAICLIPVWC